MTNLVMAIVLAFVRVEDSAPTARGACGGVGVLQITEIMYREYVRLGGQLPAEARENPVQAKQMAHLIVSERLRRAGFTSPSMDCVRYAAHLWNPGDPDYFERVHSAGKFQGLEESLPQKSAENAKVPMVGKTEGGR